MSRIRLGARLVGADLRRRSAETLLLLLALSVAATTLTIGLVLHGQTGAPYALTRNRTAGPDVVALLFPAPGKTLTAGDLSSLKAEAARPGVAASSRAFPTTWAPIGAHGVNGVAQVQGRDLAASSVDRPEVIDGRWVGGRGVVVERAFAQAMGVTVGEMVALGRRQVRVVGIAVSAALPPYPQLCTVGCILDRPDWFSAQPGLVWTTRHRAVALASPSEPVVWFEYLKLHHPDAARAFASASTSNGPPQGRPQLTPWQDIAGRQAEQLANERVAVVFGSTLLIMLALATLIVLVGGRMTDEVRRVGMLKAAGATPGFVTRLLLVSYLSIGLLGAALGIAAGRLLAPRLVTLSAGLLGHVGATTLSMAQAFTVTACVLAVVVLACAVPAWRAARTSTLQALTDGGRPPRRNRLLVAVSATMPTPALLGLRLAGRRPRRAVLTTLSVAVAVCGAVVVLYAQASLNADRTHAGGPADPQAAQLHTVTTTLTLLLAVMAAVNLLFVTRANAADARHTLAVARALGASPAESAAALGLAQLIPALTGLVLGLVTGVLLFHTLSSSDPVAPPTAHLIAMAILTVILVAALTAGPARVEALRPISKSLRDTSR
ncbi:MAG TPA: FtsX-like permease family protein [Nocardioides sp.]|uniref:ABC transporter permease n=1 Tax=Nocardioides sp. TaxID=35761 RepID=UPI002E366960|nr:FtsX-like permease family protein [Nocardioides sp.]HEX3930101.1 FtsX-like permease family protein [Nocardioides sp.]